MKKIRETLIKIGHAEGVSFLILLFIAMPLKYMADMPLAVRIAGSIHGVLFIAFVIALWRAYAKMKLGIVLTGKAFALSIIPFGTFFLSILLPHR